MKYLDIFWIKDIGTTFEQPLAKSFRFEYLNVLTGFTTLELPLTNPLAKPFGFSRLLTLELPLTMQPSRLAVWIYILGCNNNLCFLNTNPGTAFNQPPRLVVSSITDLGTAFDHPSCQTIWICILGYILCFLDYQPWNCL